MRRIHRDAGLRMRLVEQGYELDRLRATVRLLNDHLEAVLEQHVALILESEAHHG